MTAPDLQRQLTRERIEREAEGRHRQVARQVRDAGGRVAIVRARHVTRATIWPTRMRAASGGLPPTEPLAISWVEYAATRGWISATGHVGTAADGASWQAWVLTPAGRRFAAEIGRDELTPPLPGDRDIPRVFRDPLRDLFRPKGDPR
jgi:hypothetical protein